MAVDPLLGLVSQGPTLPHHHASQGQGSPFLLDLMKSYGKQRNLHKAMEIHSHIILHENMFPKELSISNSLVRMYIQCGALAEAKEVFDDLILRNVGSWNALIAGYVQKGLHEEAIDCFTNMLKEGISPNVVTFSYILKACSSLGSLELGIEIHEEIMERGLLKRNAVLGTSLVDMYAKCNMMENAQEVFESLPIRNLISWSALIAGYARHGLGEEALNCFMRMQDEGLVPDAITFVCMLKACGHVGCLKMGEEIHGEIKKRELLRENIILGTALVGMYAKCKVPEKAQKVFDDLPIRDSVSWNTLISGYVENGLGEKALNCFKQMRNDGFPPSVVTFICVLKACGSVGSYEMGEEIYEEVKRRKLLQKNAILGASIVDMFVKCNMIGKAKEAFEKLPIRNIACWSTLIIGYAEHNRSNDALNCFRGMQDEGLAPDAITFICILKACNNIDSLSVGEEIYAEVKKQGLLEKDVVLGTALVDMFAKCTTMQKAQEVFDQLPTRNIVSWNALIAGYSQHGLSYEALHCFVQMQDEKIFPDAVTFACILKACGNIGFLEMGEQIHAQVKNYGLIENHIILGNAIVDMYSKCSMLGKAQEVFDGLPKRDVVSWNTLIYGYTQHDLGDRALECFLQMKDESISPNEITYICILKSCGSLGCLEMGDEIYAQISKQELLETDTVLHTALVDMYAKCGMVEKAQQVFNDFRVRNIVSWNALISGYAQLGQIKSVLYSISKMVAEDICPDTITFLIMLCACGHVGLLEEGHIAFNNMDVYHLSPTIKHYACMVDLFGRAGHFEKAVAMIEKTSSFNNLPLWLSLLGACQKWLNVKLGRWAFDQSTKVDEKCAVAYVCMGNIYAAVGMSSKTYKLEAQRADNKVLEMPRNC